VNTQSRPEISLYFSNNESDFAQFFRQQFKRFNDECQLPSRYLNWMLCSKCSPAAATHENQVSFEIIALSMNYCDKSFHVDTRQQGSLQASARQCWTVLAWISDSIPALHPTRYNPMDFGLANSVVNLFFQWNQGILNLISCSLWKMNI